MKTKRYELIQKGVEVVRFESISEMVETALTGEPLPDNSNMAKLHREREPEKFTNYYTVKKAQDELTTPPTATARIEAIREKLDTITHIETTKRRLVRNRIEGEELDPEEVLLRRNPEAWLAIERHPAKKQLVKIACNIVISGFRKPADLYFRGAAAVAVADNLELSGHSVQLDLVISTKGLYKDDKRKDLKSVIIATIKRPEQMIDINTAALVLGEIGFFRTVCFLVDDVCANGKEEETLGQPATMPEDIRAEYDIALESDIFTLEDAIKAVKKYGGEDFTA